MGCILARRAEFRRAVPRPKERYGARTLLVSYCTGEAVEVAEKGRGERRRQGMVMA